MDSLCNLLCLLELKKKELMLVKMSEVLDLFSLKDFKIHKMGLYFIILPTHYTSTATENLARFSTILKKFFQVNL